MNYDDIERDITDLNNDLGEALGRIQQIENYLSHLGFRLAMFAVLIAVGFGMAGWHIKSNDNLDLAQTEAIVAINKNLLARSEIGAKSAEMHAETSKALTELTQRHGEYVELFKQQSHLLELHNEALIKINRDADLLEDK